MSSFRKIAVPMSMSLALISSACTKMATPTSELAAASTATTLPPYAPQSLTVAFAASASPEAQADFNDGSYVVVFAYQGNGLFNLPANSHTYASFFKVEHDADGRAVMTDSHTISWLPQDGFISIAQNVAKAGRNYTLNETTNDAVAKSRVIRHTGFYAIDDALFEKLKNRKEYLDLGSDADKIFYKVVPSLSDRSRALAWGHHTATEWGASNCIHGVSDAIRTPGSPMLDTGTKRGFAASDLVFSTFSPWLGAKVSSVHDKNLVKALLTAESSGDVVIGRTPSDGGDDDQLGEWTTVQNLSFFGPAANVAIQVPSNPFVTDVRVSKTGSCGPTGTFYAVVKVGPGSSQFGPTVQDANDPSLWHPNSGNGRNLNLIQLILQSPYQGLSCAVRVEIR